jgi:hypothetical protein
MEHTKSNLTLPQNGGDMSVTCHDGKVIVMDAHGSVSVPIDTVKNCIQVYEKENGILSVDCPTCAQMAADAKAAQDPIISEVKAGKRCPDCGRPWDRWETCPRCGMKKDSPRYLEFLEEFNREYP